MIAVEAEEEAAYMNIKKKTKLNNGNEV